MTQESLEEQSPRIDSAQARVHAFGDAIDALKREIEPQVGVDDVDYIRKVDRFSRTAEVVGRALIHFSVEPISFFTGVTCLWLHKQLQAMEIGHTALHGAFDDLPGAERFRSNTFYWDVPIDESSWRHVHNTKHHPHTSVAGMDPDIHFGFLRMTEFTPHHAYHRLQIPFALFVLAPNFTLLTCTYQTGLNDLYFTNGRPERFDLVSDRSWRSFVVAHRRFFRKVGPYLFKEYVVFPLLAGPFFGKVMFGNWLAGTMRDLWIAGAIYCNHTGVHLSAYPEGTRARSRGEYYARVVESTRNISMGPWMSVLHGALDLHIEHHLFPKLPTNRLRELAPRVEAICRAHGVRYEKTPWTVALVDVVKKWVQLSGPSVSNGETSANAAA